MRPSSTQILAGIRWSFETFIVPELTSRLSQSAGRSIALLLDHLQARVETEGQLLTDDNADMRRLFTELADLLEPALREAASPQIQDAAAELREKARRQYRPAGAYPTIASLTEENEDMKRSLVEVIRALQGLRDGLLEDVHARADRAIRTQLRRQLDREHAWILPVAGMRPY